jgi:hypothetical protein
MERDRSRSSPRRDLLQFIFGPALVTVAITAWFAVRPWPVPVPGQAQEFTLPPVATSLALATLGVWLSSRVGLPSAPALGDGRRWSWLLLTSVLLGVVFAGASAVIDASLGLQRILAQRIGQPSMNVPFPASIAHYTCGGVLQECLFRIGPIPILTWVFGKLLFRDGAKPAVFWTVAIVLSLLEPVGEAAMMARAYPVLALTSASVGVFGNVAWVALYRRYGWPVLIIVRVVLELGWHVVWPAVSP